MIHDAILDERIPRTADAAPRIRSRAPAADAAPRFVIGDELGRGGMGRVVAAVDTMLDREVAIKQALGDDVDGARFEREARITAQLEHASIVPVHDAGCDDRGRPYYVMRRIAGEPLAGRIADAAAYLAARRPGARHRRDRRAPRHCARSRRPRRRGDRARDGARWAHRAVRGRP